MEWAMMVAIQGEVFQLLRVGGVLSLANIGKWLYEGNGKRREFIPPVTQFTSLDGDGVLSLPHVSAASINPASSWLPEPGQSTKT